ncbi:formyltransferase family protein [Oricola sp.]|uniref:formyltransferase family protein n=1 Tax=Oricola sp. TaxID=1979950 RepID=UPI000C98B431|nr:hypothetical protein [Ahrensia sp.]
MVADQLVVIRAVRYGIAVKEHMSPANALFIAEPCLISSHVTQAWLDQGNRIAAFWTVSGRFGSPSLNDRLSALASGAPTLAAIARRHAIPVRRVPRLSEIADLEHEIERTGADTLLTIMTPVLIPASILDVFGRRAVNVHPALLPKYAGSRPRHTMLVDGKADEYGGVTFHQLTPKIDAGPIIAQRARPFSETPHFAAWDFAFARAAAEITRKELPAYLEGTRDAVPQDPSERHYRKTYWNELTITKERSLAEARHLLDCAPGMPPRWARDKSDIKNHSVHSLAAVLGPPTGQAPVLGALTIEADIADARICMRRGRLARATYGRPFLPIVAYRLSRPKQ